MSTQGPKRRKRFELARFLDPDIDVRPIRLIIGDLHALCASARSVGWRLAMPRLGLRTFVSRLRALRLEALTAADVSEGLLPLLDTPDMPKRLRDAIADVAVRSHAVPVTDLLQSPHAEVRMAAILEGNARGSVAC